MFIREIHGLNLRLLLCHAVNRTHAPHKWFAVDRDDLSGGEDSLQRIDRAFVVGVTKHRSEHDVVSNVEVCVAGGQTFEIACAGTAAADNSGHG